MTGIDAATPVTALKGVGPKLAARLARLGLRGVGELPLHLPLRYENRSERVMIAGLRPGDHALVEGEIGEVGQRGRILRCRIADASGALTLIFFNAAMARRGGFAPGVTLRCFGEVRGGRDGLEMTHPDCQRVAPDAPPPRPALTPFYPSTDGLPQATLRGLIAQALRLDDAALELCERLPAPLRERLGLPELAASLRRLHGPEPSDAAMLAAGRHPAQRRVAFEELLAHQLGLRRLREEIRADRAPALDRAAGDALRGRFLAALPFALTAAQRRVAADIVDDLARPRPMLRLLQGDVGSGKTVVAALAALGAVAAGRQAALMAPTELLSEQHVLNLHGWLEPLGVDVTWLTGRLKTAARRDALARIADGRAQIAVGTHALFQDRVSFADLAVVIVDEQHRFGVHQRLALRAKGEATTDRVNNRPHQLIMTATPIPRTLAMSAYADLDTSIIDELPPGRTPVTTVAVPDTRRGAVIDRIRAACGAGRQTYWVCTLIEESDALQAQDAEQTAERLREALPGHAVGLAHGRLDGGAKAAVMTAFKRGELDVLVATTVIEVGVDVPNASLMIIENPERLGIAQLHQLRGRVGRGAVASHCVLLYRAPLSAAAKQKLGALRASNDGFVIAEKDLELRGPGEVLGARQTGALQFRVADLRRDADLLTQVREVADELLRDYPEQAAAVAARWSGGGEEYAGV